MIRLTLHQFRLHAIVAVAASTLAAILLAITGLRLAHLYDTTVANCAAQGNCDVVKVAFFNHYLVLWQLLGPFILLVPALVGIFWGAPLVARELETGTYRLAWTQSVSRIRWLLVKVGVVGVTSIAITGLLSWLVTWWLSPIDKLNLDRFQPGTFDERGIVAIGYALFAFAVGVTAGAVVRRSLPAMAIALVVFVGVRIIVALVLRPRFVTPAHIDMPVGFSSNVGFSPTSSGSGFTVVMGEAPSIPNAWTVSSEIVDKSGHKASQAALAQLVQTACPDLGKGPPTASVFHNCVSQISTKYHLVVAYQPANRYWAFQWMETAIFVGLALILAGFCFWWVRFRLA